MACIVRLCVYLNLNTLPDKYAFDYFCCCAFFSSLFWIFFLGVCCMYACAFIIKSWHFIKKAAATTIDHFRLSSELWMLSNESEISFAFCFIFFFLLQKKRVFCYSICEISLIRLPYHDIMREWNSKSSTANNRPKNVIQKKKRKEKRDACVSEWVNEWCVCERRALVANDDSIVRDSKHKP